ncbi:MAG: hypothetical protein AB8G96_15745 [Phycisphaerales bacterium]
MIRSTNIVAGLGGLFLAAAAAGQGGWERQDLTLEAGWNLVWLEVEPSDLADDPASVFGPDVDAVSAFIPGRRAGDRGAWRSWYAAEPAFTANLAEIQGDRGYFVRATSVSSVSIVGRPVRRSRPVAGGAPALFGAAVDAVQRPLVADYFAISDAVDRLSELNAFDTVNGDFVTVDPGLQAITGGQAAWITTSVDQDYAGPIRLSAAGGGLQFGKTRYGLDLAIEVAEADVDRSVFVDAIASAAPPAGEPFDAGAGDASWLEYRRIDPLDGTMSWESFDTPLEVVIPANQSRVVLALRADRNGRAPACIDIDGGLYQALIEVRDDLGHREIIAAGMEVLDDRTGTWVGEVTVDAVNLNAELGGGGPEGAEPLTFGIILEIAADGTGRILDQICIATATTVNPDGTAGDNERFTTFGAVLFPEIVELDVQLDGSFPLPPTHPLNPYRHRYNPLLTEGPDLIRSIDLDITSEDPTPPNPVYGDLLRESAGNNTLVGLYSETISGLSHETITVTGTFRLQRFSERIGLRDCPE